MTYRCPICRTRRKDHGLFTRHLEQSGHGADQLCRCLAYTYPHRKGTGLCIGAIKSDAPAKRGRGRPKAVNPLTPAQRAKAYRDRKKENAARGWPSIGGLF